MKTKKCIAMILAGGRGERLGALTHHYSKPAIHFGGGYRIIDFTLSNCKSSRIDTIGVLSQCFTTDLNEYINYINSFYDGGPEDRGVHLLSSESGNGYKGTADAVYQNLSFIDRFMPEYVLILASDHIYKMDYNKLIAFHEEKGADATVASIPVSLEEASRFGILRAGEDGRVLEFEEKPLWPKSNLASMGIYVFNWNLLKKYLQEDSGREKSKHDFGKDILPETLLRGKLYTYQFNGYWRDVGTVDKLWEANMDLLNNTSNPQLVDRKSGVCGSDWKGTGSRFSDKAVISQSILSEGCLINGYVKHSVLGSSVTVGNGAEIVNSVIMPNAYIGNNVKIFNAIVGNLTVIGDNAVIGKDYGSDFFVDRQVCAGNVSLVSPCVEIDEGMEIQKNSHIIKEKLDRYYLLMRKRSDIQLETARYAIV